jgi:hypothetical protein
MARTRRLCAEERRVLAYLQSQWDRLFRLTTIAQGMAALGLPADDERRLRLGDHLLAHPAAHPVVARWGARTLILTEDEKLLGRYLAQRAAAGAGRVPAAGAAAAIGRTVPEVTRGLTVLQHVGLIDWRLANDTIAYTLAPDWQERAGPLAFTFHTVTLQSGERFNVPCALDFLLLGASEHAAERVLIDDSCVHCTDRIRVVIDHGQIAAVEPPETVVFYGGG